MDGGSPARPPIVPPRPARPPPPPAQSQPPAWLHTAADAEPDIAPPVAAPSSAYHAPTTSLSSSTSTRTGALEVSFDLSSAADHSRSGAAHAHTVAAAARSASSGLTLSLTPNPSQPASPTSAAHFHPSSSPPPPPPERPIPPEHDSASYSLLSLLGQGGFASVYRAVFHPTGREVAIKVFDLEAQWCAYMEKGDELDEILGGGGGAGVVMRRRQQRRGMRERNDKYKMEEVWREVTVTANLRHPNICKFAYCFASTPATNAGSAAASAAQSHHPSASPSPCQPSSRQQQQQLQVPLAVGSPMSPLSPSPTPHPSSPSSCSHDPALANANANGNGELLNSGGAGIALSAATLGGFISDNGASDPAQFCVVMPLCEGSLKQLLSALYPLGLKDEAALACILQPLLSVLAYLHSSTNHKIHRDIKIDNILLDRRASIMLADWGIAEDFWSERGGVGADGMTADDCAGADGDEGSDDEDDAAAAEEEAAVAAYAAASNAAEATGGNHSRSPSSHAHKSSMSGVAVGSLRGKSRRAQALAAAKAKFAGTPLMMAPEVLAQAGLSSMLPPEAVSPGGHLRHASALLPAVSSPRGSAALMGQGQNSDALAAAAKRHRSASAVALSPVPSSSPSHPSGGPLPPQAQAAAWAAGLDSSASFRRTQSFRTAASTRAKCDIWSLGITALEMAFGAPPHASSPAAQAHDPLHLRKLIMDSPAPSVSSCAREFAQAQGQLPAALAKEALSPPLFGFSKHFHDFVAQALVKDPARRASAAQLLNHPFIKKNYTAKTTTVAPQQQLPLPIPQPLSVSLHADPSAAAAASASSAGPAVAAAAAAASAADRSPLVVHKLLYERLLEPWQRLVRERRVREEKERKEAERLAKKSLSKSQMRALAMQQAQDALLAAAGSAGGAGGAAQVQVPVHGQRPPLSASSPRHAASASASAIFPAAIAEAPDA